MKPRSQVITADGFDKNVAEKMPKIRKLEAPLLSILEVEPETIKEDRQESPVEARVLEKPIEKKPIFESPKKEAAPGQNLDVLKLIEDLHTQLLASGRTKRALEMDLTTSQKTIHQLARDNQMLRSQLGDLNEDLQKLKKIQAESVYLTEENTDALEKIQEFQQKLRGLKETLAITIQEKDDALSRIHDLESQIEQSEVQQVRGRLKEREASHFFEENQELQSKLEEALAQNIELEKKYETLKKSFNEVRESLTFLRDSCKTNFYNLSEGSE